MVSPLGDSVSRCELGLGCGSRVNRLFRLTQPRGPDPDGPSPARVLDVLGAFRAAGCHGLALHSW